MAEPAKPKKRPPQQVHLRMDSTYPRAWCGRLLAKLQRVHAGDPAQVPPHLPVCGMCVKSRAKHHRSIG